VAFRKSESGGRTARRIRVRLPQSCIVFVAGTKFSKCWAMSFKCSRSAPSSNAAWNGEGVAAARAVNLAYTGWLPAGLAFAATRCPENRVFHQGIDISTSEGQSGYATGDGVRGNRVVLRPITANLVVIEHASASHAYGHLSRCAVAPGRVKRGR